MLAWLMDWVKSLLGHWLLASEEEEERRRDVERARKQRDIVEARYETSETADDLDDGRF